MKQDEKENKIISMHEQLVTLVKAMKDDGFNFLEQAAVFKWQYEDFDDILFELAIYDKSLLEGSDEVIPQEELESDDLTADWRKLH